MKVMSMRKRLDPQVLGLLTELDDNTSLREDERDEMRDVLRSLWEPWYIPRDKIQYTLKNGAKKVLGTGGYGRVYLASVPTADGSMLPVAVKELDGVFAKPKFKVDFEREVALLRDLSHPCIIGFVGAAWPESQMTCRAHNAADGANGFLDDTYGDGLDDDQDETAIIVTERMNCNLSSALRKGLLSDDGTKARAMLDVSEGMVYLHAKRVVHMVRDVLSRGGLGSVHVRPLSAWPLAPSDVLTLFRAALPSAPRRSAGHQAGEHALSDEGYAGREAHRRPC
jgi:hypothetical protein